jgi:hypothetical protein
MYTLIMLMIAGAAIIGFCLVFALFSGNGTIADRATQRRIGKKIVKGLYR